MYTTCLQTPHPHPHCHSDGAATAGSMISIDAHDGGRPLPVPAPATPGLMALPGTGRLVWWTGRVAIGLRYQRAGAQGVRAPVSSSSAWIQNLLLS